MTDTTPHPSVENVEPSPAPVPAPPPPPCPACGNALPCECVMPCGCPRGS